MRLTQRAHGFVLSAAARLTVSCARRAAAALGPWATRTSSGKNREGAQKVRCLGRRGPQIRSDGHNRNDWQSMAELHIPLPASVSPRSLVEHAAPITKQLVPGFSGRRVLSVVVCELVAAGLMFTESCRKTEACELASAKRLQGLFSKPMNATKAVPLPGSIRCLHTASMSRRMPKLSVSWLLGDWRHRRAWHCRPLQEQRRRPRATEAASERSPGLEAEGCASSS